MSRSLEEVDAEIATVVQQIAGASARLGYLNAERAKISEEFTASFADIRRALSVINLPPLDSGAKAHVTTGEAQGSRAEKVTSSPAKEILAAVEQIIESSGSPMMPKDLIPALEQRGLRIGGKSPASTLSAKLSQSSRFEREKNGWIVATESEVHEALGPQPLTPPAPLPEPTSHERTAIPATRQLNGVPPH